MLPGGCRAAGGKRLLDGAGTLGQKAHSALRKCQGLSAILFLSQCACPSPAFLSLCSFPLFPAGLWGWSQKVHRPETLQGMLVLTEHNRLMCLVVQLLLKSHPCSLILTLASSSSHLHSTQSPQFIPTDPQHCPGHAGPILLLPLPKCSRWLSPAPQAPKRFSEWSVRLKPWDPSGSGG